MANFFKTKKARGVLNVVFSIGAAIVIFGALAKIEHWGGAWGSALTIGMLTETFVFILMAFQPAEDIYHWEKFYPNILLSPEEEKKLTGEYKQMNVAMAVQNGGSPVLGSMDKMLQDADITPSSLQKLGENFQRLERTVGNMSDVADVVSVTGEYTQQTKEASYALEKMRDAYLQAADTVASFNQSAGTAQEFHNQIQLMTKNLGSLNAIYEVELQDTSKHLKAINNFYGTLATASESMAESIEDSQRTQEQLALLAQNLSNLNAVYGNMLSAMRR